MKSYYSATSQSIKQRTASHRRTVQNPQIKRAIGRLSRNWDALSMIERGESLCVLTAAGCSRRGLAEDLGRSATSIRRYMTIANLPEADKKRIQGGESAKKILAVRAEADRLQVIQQRLAEDAETGSISDKLADEILEFIKTETGLREDTLDFVTVLTSPVARFFAEVRNWLTQLRSSRGQFVRRSLPLERRLELTCPQPQKEESAFDHNARWLALFLKSQAPEKPILDRALDKARKRENELKVHKTARQRLKEMESKLKELSEPLPRRKY